MNSAGCFSPGAVSGPEQTACTSLSLRLCVFVLTERKSSQLNNNEETQRGSLSADGLTQYTRSHYVKHTLDASEQVQTAARSMHAHTDAPRMGLRSGICQVPPQQSGALCAGTLAR